MDRKQYFEELHIALTREGFTSQPKQGELLPVEWGGLPLCRITADGGVRYWQEDVATPERERACERATDLACTVREYMTLLEQAPPLQAQSLTDDYRLLADFNGAVLAAHPTRLGVQFVTWDWSFDHTGLNQGNYFQENYVGAKQDFAIRAGLISKQQIFNQEQLVEIYRCCSDTLDVNRFNEEDQATYMALMRATIGEAIGLTGGTDEIDLLRRKIDGLNRKMVSLINESAESGEGIESHEAEFKELSDTIELLQGRIQKLEEALASDQANDSRILQLQQIIADRASKKMEYDDTIVHQMIECVKVYPDGRLDIIFGGGYLIEERLEKES